MIRKYIPTLIALASFCNGIAAIAGTTTAEKAVADVMRAQTKLHSLKSLTADVTLTAGGSGKKGTEHGTIKCLKPNYLWIDMGVGKDRRYHISDGKNYCTNDSKGQWTSIKADPHGANFRDDLMIWSDFYVFYAAQNTKGVFANKTVTIAHKTIDGQQLELISTIDKGPHPMALTIGIASDGLIHRFAIDAGPQHIAETWSNVKINPPLKPADFKPKY